MKTRILFISAAVLAAALSLVSCSKNEPAPTTEGQSLTLTMPGNAGTRAVYEANIQGGVFKGISPSWEVGDEMTVGVMGDSDNTSTFKAVSADIFTTFTGKANSAWGTLADGMEFWALYPKIKAGEKVRDWTQQDGSLAGIADLDFLFSYAKYNSGRLEVNEIVRQLYLFRFPKGFGFCDKTVNGEVTLAFSGEDLFSKYEFAWSDCYKASGENAILVGPVELSNGMLTQDLYVAACAATWGVCKEIKITVIPDGESWVKQYALSYPAGFDMGRIYTITDISKLQLVTDAEFVDLGLPSGVKWATCNVGATSPGEYGDYFAWGETASKTDYSWATYFDTSDNGKTFYKYATDWATELDSNDDAAFAALGWKSRMPTTVEWKELIDECDWAWKTTSDGYANNGFLVTGPNNNTIFLPAAGFQNGTTLTSDGAYGSYWASGLAPAQSPMAGYVDFFSGDKSILYTDRYYGQSVRAVCD